MLLLCFFYYVRHYPIDHSIDPRTRKQNFVH
jgi:hypothetical protein